MKVSAFIKLCGGATKVSQIISCHRDTVNKWCKFERMPIDKVQFLYEVYKDVMPQSVVQSVINDMK